MNQGLNKYLTKKDLVMKTKKKKKNNPKTFLKESSKKIIPKVFKKNVYPLPFDKSTFDTDANEKNTIQSEKEVDINQMKKNKNPNGFFKVMGIDHESVLRKQNDVEVTNGTHEEFNSLEFGYDSRFDNSGSIFTKQKSKQIIQQEINEFEFSQEILDNKDILSKEIIKDTESQFENFKQAPPQIYFLKKNIQNDNSPSKEIISNKINNQENPVELKHSTDKQINNQQPNFFKNLKKKEILSKSHNEEKLKNNQINMSIRENLEHVKVKINFEKEKLKLLEKQAKEEFLSDLKIKSQKFNNFLNQKSKINKLTAPKGNYFPQNQNNLKNKNPILKKTKINFKKREIQDWQLKQEFKTDNYDKMYHNVQIEQISYPDKNSNLSNHQFYDYENNIEEIIENRDYYKSNIDDEDYIIQDSYHQENIVNSPIPQYIEPLNNEIILKEEIKNNNESEKINPLNYEIESNNNTINFDKFKNNKTEFNQTNNFEIKNTFTYTNKSNNTNNMNMREDFNSSNKITTKKIHEDSPQIISKKFEENLNSYEYKQLMIKQIQELEKTRKMLETIPDFSKNNKKKESPIEYNQQKRSKNNNFPSKDKAKNYHNKYYEKDLSKKSNYSVKSKLPFRERESSYRRHRKPSSNYFDFT